MKKTQKTDGNIVVAAQGQARQKRQRNRLRIFVIIVLILLLLGGGALAGASFYFSSQILEVIHYTPTYAIPVLAISPTTVTLQRGILADVMHPGEFEIEWPGGQAIVGPILSSNEQSVTRRLVQTTGSLTPGTDVYWTRNVYTGKFKHNLGLTINDVQVPDPLGAMPAWYVPGKSSTWAILVHGRGDSRDATLRVFTPLAQLGLPLLSISYRNDLGAPASPDNFNHLGDSEWQDLQAAVRYAQAHGAQHLLLYGWSEGGSIIEEFVHHSSQASLVQAMVLDAPVLSWPATLTYQAQRLNVPGWLANGGEVVATMRAGVDFAALDQTDQLQPAIPVLLFQGLSDTSTPPAVSASFAKANANIVTYVPVSGTEHTEVWNTDPQSYDQALSAFLTQKLAL